MYNKKVKCSKINNFGNNPWDEDDIYDIETFKECCETGTFIDYDGYGHPVKDGFSDESIDIRPSCIHLIPEDATHIVWFNR